MTNTTKEQLIVYMLNLIDKNDKELVAKATENFNVSKSSVYNYLNQLCKEGVIEKNGSSYKLVYEKHCFEYDNNGKLEEDRIFTRDIEPLLSNLEKNVRSIWRYSFTEMMNNAIEHSVSDSIRVILLRNRLKITVYIADRGIGIFKNIQKFYKEQNRDDLSLRECASMLFAGKFTTAQSMHSGEGIFFTSHMMDDFLIISDGINFSRNSSRDVILDDQFNLKRGTIVSMTLYNQNKKTTQNVFGRFSTIDEGFIKTSIPIACFFPGGNPVSRSEARRLGESILKFEDIDLDFADVSEIGQAFVHELFIVWQERHPSKKLNVLNANGDVNFMIKRVLNTK